MILISTANADDVAAMGIAVDDPGVSLSAHSVDGQARLTFSGPEGEVELVGTEALWFIAAAYDWLHDLDPDWFHRSGRNPPRPPLRKD